MEFDRRLGGDYHAASFLSNRFQYFLILNLIFILVYFLLLLRFIQINLVIVIGLWILLIFIFFAVLGQLVTEVHRDTIQFYFI